MFRMFRLRITRAARVAMPPREQEAVIDELGRLAEASAPNAGEYAIFDVHDYGLKAVVNFNDRTLWILTPEEYRKAGLPQPPAGSG